MKIWMKDVWCVKNKRPAVGSHFPLHSIDRDNAHQTNTQKARKKSQPTLIAKSAQSPLGCVDLYRRDGRRGGEPASSIILPQT